MTDPGTDEVVVPNYVPLDWANSLVRWVLRAPVLGKWRGSSPRSS